MRAAATTLLLLTVLVAVAATPASAKATRYGAPCGSRTAKTVERTATSRVYSVRSGLYGCLRGRHRAFLLGEALDGYGSKTSGIRQVALAGHYVATADEQVNATVDAAFSVAVRDLRTGGLVNVTSQGSPALAEAYLDRLVLDRRGRVAFSWSRRTPVPGASSSRVERLVWRSPGCGPRQVAAGPGLETGSLRLDGTTLSWQQDGAPQSAPLCPARAQSGR